jgi:hypothetical protein
VVGVPAFVRFSNRHHIVHFLLPADPHGRPQITVFM